MPSLATLSGPVWVARRAIPFSLLILSLSRGGRAAPASPRIQSEALVVSRARASVFMREVHLRNYTNIHTLFGVPREDDGTTLFASLAYPIRKSRTLSLEYLRDRNKSNIALFDYVRNVTSLAMTWTF